MDLNCQTYIVWSATAVLEIIGTLLSIAFLGALVISDESVAAIFDGAFRRAVPSIIKTVLRVAADITVPVFVHPAAGLF